MHQSHPKPLSYQYHQLKKATLSMLYPRDGAKNRWLNHLVQRYRLFFENLPYFQLDQDTLQVICRHLCLCLSSRRWTDFLNSNNIRFQSFRFDGIMNRNTDIASRGNQKRIDFGNRNSLSDSNILYLTRLARNNFNDRV